ncbi:MAG: ATP-binding protein [Bacteroidetes bacterium]|nr:ATP-binding protein [Bacteroidota bacterium]MBL6944331.1 ATP-binding protein [Bacteroidales bacterium]
MFNRTNIIRLRNWANEKDRKPLVLRGARQTGKTTLIDIFAKDFDQYIYLNLEKEKESKLFDGSFSIPQLLDAIFYLKDVDKNKGSTLLFIDEIQNNPNAVATLRYFYEEAKDLFVVAAGSLLETLIDKTISFPVGRVDYMPVRPCSFIEYLSALGETSSLEIILSGQVPDYAHDKLSELFRTYTIIGGMPEIINEYCKSRDMNRLKQIYERLIVSYQDDVEKYAQNQTMARVIRHIIGSAFQYAGTRITFEKFGQSTYRSREMSEAFRTLEKTMLLQLEYPVSKTRLPIEEKLRLSPKLLMLDTGLVNYSSGIQKEMVISNLIDEVYKGKIAEHIAGQELLALKPSVRSKLNFWVPKNPNAQAELDYVWPWEDMLIPIEVKSGATGSLRSLHRFVDEAPHSWAVRIYTGKYKIEDIATIKGKKFKLINLPYYLVGQIDKILKANIA